MKEQLKAGMVDTNNQLYRTRKQAYDNALLSSVISLLVHDYPAVITFDGTAFLLAQSAAGSCPVDEGFVPCMRCVAGTF